MGRKRVGKKDGTQMTRIKLILTDLFQVRIQKTPVILKNFEIREIYSESHVMK